MRNFASLIVGVCLLSSPAAALGQPSDPFAVDPFAVDPFGGGKSKSQAVKGAHTEQAAKLKAAKVPQKKAVPAQAIGREKSIATRVSSEITQRIRASLDDQTTQTFIDTPLQDALQQLSETHDIPILVDKRALEEVGLTPDTPVVLSLRNVSLRSFLRLMLRELELTYIVKDEVMQITTVAAAEQNISVEMYKFSEELTGKSDKIIKSLTSAVEPAAWEVSGGPCSVTAIDNVLIVSAPDRIHEQVIEFLQKLQQAFEKHKAKK